SAKGRAWTKWRRSGRSPMILAPDARAGQAFAVNYNDGSGPGSIDVLDATSGALQRVIPVGMFPHALAVDDEHGRAFVANEAAPWRRMGDSLSVVDTCVGREIRRLPLSVPIVTLSIDRTLGRVFIVLQNDRLQIRDAATLRSVRAITPAEGGSRSFLLGVTPSAMVADERNARVVVVGHVAHGAARTGAG